MRGARSSTFRCFASAISPSAGPARRRVAIALAKQAKRMHLKPGFLSRGHGGNVAEPHIVDRRADSARQVGDEPLLLAEHALTAITPNRPAGARLLMERGCDFLIMDDGFQSAQHPHGLCAGRRRRPLRRRQRPCPSGRSLARPADRSGALRHRHREDGRGKSRRSGGAAGRARGQADLRGIHQGARRGPLRAPALPGLCRHRTSRQVLRHDRGGRRHGRDGAVVSGPSFLFERRASGTGGDRADGGTRTDHHGEGRHSAAQRHRAAGFPRPPIRAGDRRRCSRMRMPQNASSTKRSMPGATVA